MMTQHAFVFILESEAIFYLDGEKTSVRQGQSLFIRKDTILSSQPPPHAPFRCSWIHFSPPGGISEISEEKLKADIMEVKNRTIPGSKQSIFILPETEEVDFYIPTVLDLGDSADDIASIMRMNLRERSMPSLNSAQMLSNGMNQILILATRRTVSATCGEKIRSVNTLPLLVQKALFIMQDKYNSLKGISEIARELRITPQHLIRIFKKTLGTTPLVHLQGIRIRKSCELLLHSGMTVKEIAFSVGCNDQRYFSRVFRRAMGMTPSEYIEHRYSRTL
ncbi:MAG: helix-turn-helix domain-containing protein [Victivallales bacterium]|nr:helix-turn-helix domain-containing protein [Victivallales bacterium]